MDWVDLAQDRDQWGALVNVVMKPQIPKHFGKFLSSCATGGFSRRTQLHGVRKNVSGLHSCSSVWVCYDCCAGCFGFIKFI
jgi:hypothetical protein